MRLIKMFSLAALTAVVGMAFIGASSALAVLDPETVICKSNVELCPEAEILPKGAVITAVALEGEKAPILLGQINEKCKKSTIKVEISSTGGMGQPLKGKEPTGGGGLTFSECSPCSTVTASAGEGTLEMTGANLWSLNTSGSTKFSNCTFGVSCAFSGSAVSLTAQNDAAAGGLLVLAEKAGPFKLTEGSKLLCGETGTWDAHYIAKGHWLSTFKL
jgi:hypothetical protein